jgi:hypothetical protein
LAGIVVPAVYGEQTASVTHGLGQLQLLIKGRGEREDTRHQEKHHGHRHSHLDERAAMLPADNQGPKSDKHRSVFITISGGDSISPGTIDTQ